MYSLIRPLLFRLEPERAHDLSLRLVRAAGRIPVSERLLTALFTVRDPRLEVEAFGLRFHNPVGLAAGYDKNGIAVKGLAALGFGHIEVGTVTRRAQPGNPRPRVHRLPASRALINSMGFPNAGVEALRVERGPARIGINLGRSRETPPERAAEDYCALLERVHLGADYVAINISSPNTPGLRSLQNRAALEELLGAVARARANLAPRPPVLVKIAPDLTEAEIDDVLAAITAHGMDGVIATNTTVRREGIPARFTGLTGGWSGAPLGARATAVVRYIARQTRGALPIVGVGGILSAADALEKLRAGATLIQVYTGLIYAGPGLAREINRGLLQECERDGVQSVTELRAG